MAYPDNLPRPNVITYNGPLYSWVFAAVPDNWVNDAAPLAQDYLEDFGHLPPDGQYSYPFDYSLLPTTYGFYGRECPDAIPVRINLIRPIRILNEMILHNPAFFDPAGDDGQMAVYEHVWRPRLMDQLDCDVFLTADCDDMLVLQTNRRPTRPNAARNFIDLIGSVELIDRYYGSNRGRPPMVRSWHRLQYRLLAGHNLPDHLIGLNDIPTRGQIRLPHSEFGLVRADVSNMGLEVEERELDI